MTLTEIFPPRTKTVRGAGDARGSSERRHQLSKPSWDHGFRAKGALASLVVPQSGEADVILAVNIHMRKIHTIKGARPSATRSFFLDDIAGMLSLAIGGGVTCSQIQKKRQK